MLTRIASILLALALGAAAGFAVCDSRSRDASSDLARRSEVLAREAAGLRGERDRLASELAESKRAAAELRDASEAIRSELEGKLARLEELVAALVGTRPAMTPPEWPAPGTTPSGEDVREPN
jgi:hypothetical protein